MSSSTVTVFRNDEGSGRLPITIVAINVTIVSLDDSPKIQDTFGLGDDAMQVTEADNDTIELVTMPKEEAKQRILSYINSHVGCRTGEIVYNLGLDPDLVLECLKELESTQRVRSRNIGTD